MIRINLLPIKASRRQEAAKSQIAMAAIGAGALVLVLAVVQLSVARSVSNLEKDNNLLREDIKRYQIVVGEVQEAERLAAELEAKLQVIRDLKSRKAGPVRMLDELARATPERVQIRSLDEKGGGVDLKGVAVNSELISTFLTNLEQSPYFDSVFLVEMNQVVEQEIKLKQFVINARVVIPEEAAAPPAPADKGGA